MENKYVSDTNKILVRESSASLLLKRLQGTIPVWLYEEMLSANSEDKRMNICMKLNKLDVQP